MRFEGAVRRPSCMAAWVVGGLAAYFALQVILRIVYASSLGLDEAEMLVLTQGFAAGYGGSQPPLYTWLQIGAFGLFALGIPALAIVKNLLLWTTFAFMFFAARLVLGNELKAALATIALFAIPQIGWESQRALTHTVIAVSTAAMSLYVFLRLLQTGHWSDYPAFGACLALGVLSKYNYALFAASLLVAAASIPSFRPRVFSRWMAPALIVALVLLLAHLVWVWSNPAATLARATKFEMAGNLGLLAGAGRGILAMIEGIVSYAALAVALFALVAFVPVRRSTSEPHEAVATGGWREGRQLILRSLGVSLVLVLILVLLTRTTELRDRWLQPILFILPLGLFILLEPRFNAGRMKILALASAGLALAFMIALPVVHFFPDLGGRPKRALVPYAPLAADIRNLGFSQGYILAGDTYVAGNLKLRFPDSTVAEPEYGLWRMGAGATPKSLLIAWEGADPVPPKPLRELWQSLCGAAVQADPRPTPVTALYEHSQRMRLTLQVIVLPMCGSSSGRLEKPAVSLTNLARNDRKRGAIQPPEHYI